MVLVAGVTSLRSLGVKCFDGTCATVTADVVDHVRRKHSEVLSTLGLTEDGLFELLCSILLKPSEAYVDSSGSRYLLKQLENFCLCVIVDEGIVRTAY
jgi:hypothetical protein